VLIDEHRVCGFACYRVTEYPQNHTDPLVYSGPDVMNKFYEHTMSESEAIGAILVDDKDMTQLTDRQQTNYDNATTCGGCGEGFTPQKSVISRLFGHYCACFCILSSRGVDMLSSFTCDTELNDVVVHGLFCKIINT